MKENTTVLVRLHTGIIGMINSRANVIAFTETIKCYSFKYSNKSALYNQAVYVVTLDRLMKDYQKENK